MPPFEESVSHLPPLNLKVQIGIYLKFGRQVVESTPEHRIVRANRLRLRNWLLNQIPVQWGKRLTRVVEGFGEGIQVQFEDGTKATGDILVGADGVNSICKLVFLILSIPFRPLPSELRLGTSAS